jgi:hypothetical protein
MRTGLAAMLALVATTAVLAGCTPGTSSGGPTTNAAGGTTTAASSAPAGQSTSSKPSAVTSATTTTSAPAAATSTGVGACLVAQLTATLGAGAGGGAGHMYPFLVFTNKGTTACTVRGYPGVSFVGNGSGTQLGAAATREAAGITITTLTLAPGQSAHSQLSITVAGNYDPATCKPKAADGLRVYPPAETHSLFVASTAYTACQNASVVLMLVRPLQAGVA